MHDAASRTVCATRSQAPPASQRAGVAASVVLAVATGAISPAPIALLLPPALSAGGPSESTSSERAPTTTTNTINRMRRACQHAVSGRRPSPAAAPCRSHATHVLPEPLHLREGTIQQGLWGAAPVLPRLAPSLRAPNARAPRSMPFHRCPTAAAPRLCAAVRQLTSWEKSIVRDVKGRTVWLLGFGGSSFESFGSWRELR